MLNLSRALAEALREMGVEAVVSAGRIGAGSQGLARPCLDSVSRHEITAGGRKIVASAQRRTNLALLQHGSILLDRSSSRIVDYLKGEYGSIGNRVTSVGEESGRRASISAVKEAIIEAFGRRFGATFEEMPLTPTILDELKRREADKRAESSLFIGREVCA